MSVHKRRGARGFVGLVAGVVSAGLLSAGLWLPAVGAASLPDRIVNGGFDYPAVDMFADSENGRSYILYHEAVWAYVTAAGKHYNDHNKTGTVIAGFSQDQFGWRSNQPAMGGYPAGVVEVQEAVSGGQRFAEIIAEDDQYAIYQDIRVTPGSVLVWKLDHAPRGTQYTGGDEIQVMIGKPGHETVQTATRVSNNGSADRVGETMTTIHTSKAGDRFAPFETYRGQYTVPAGVTTVRFTFKAANNGTTGRSGNLLDNVSFQVAQHVSYHANGGNGSMSDTMFLPGEHVVVSRSQFTRPGYTFTGWNTSADGSGRPYDPEAVLQSDRDVALYAQWSGNPASLNLNPNGGQGEVTRIDGRTGQSVSTRGKTPTRPGYTLTGWNTKPDGTGTKYDPVVEVRLPAGDTTWYAIWRANESSITYRANGGNGSMSPTRGHVNDTVHTASNAFTRPGYTFTSWNTKPDGTGASIKAGEAVTLGIEPTVLYAQWQADPASLNLDPNGGQGDTVRLEGVTDETVSTQDKNPLRPGYTFIKWNTSANGTGTGYESGSEFTLPAGDTTWYAQWQANPSSIHYFLNGGEGDVPDTEGHVDEQVNVTSTIPLRTGYTLAGWKNCMSNEATMYHADSPLTLPDGGVRLCAVWTPNPAQLVYDANSGTGNMTPTAGVTDGAVSVKPNQYTREGYTFTGWNTKADGTGTAVLERSSIRLKAGTTTVYAQWQANPTTLTLDPNGGEGNPASIDGHTGETVTTEGDIPRRPGYTLTGWNTTPDGTGTSYPPVASYLLPPAPTVWYAQWKANKAVLAYNANGGDGTMSDTEGVVDGSVNVSDNAFTRSGYTFTGWNTNADGTGNTIAVGEAVKLGIEPTVVYAQWQANPATVTYDTGGADPIEPVTISDFTTPTPVTRTIPVKPHMTFTEWRFKDKPLYAGDPIPAKPGETITLIAQYEPIKSRIIYNPNGGEGTMSDTTGNAGDTVTVADNTFTRRGYTFTGWNTVEGNRVNGRVELPDEPVVLVAQWQPNKVTITYDPNGGEGEKVDVEGEYDQPVPATDKANDWHKDCAKLAGWNTKADGTGTAYTIQDNTLILDGNKALAQENMTLYAQWQHQSCPQPEPAGQVAIPTQAKPEPKPLATTGSSILGIAAVGILILLAAVGVYTASRKHK